MRSHALTSSRMKAENVCQLCSGPQTMESKAPSIREQTLKMPQAMDTLEHCEVFGF